ncbi:uncharacterized protein LOC117082196 isoform X2 [Trachypithecus francoisi]|uniref:uncharacterized protein LOC117082196 isoform X2 n=1 Tax=Trachypithecus francoisi TaxID=54180 RepID=UPI00141AAFD2|nr:uncharacterized protein LOC117082196 isoform X2 [Trachypithecus francoisi]
MRLPWAWLQAQEERLVCEWLVGVSTPAESMFTWKHISSPQATHCTLRKSQDQRKGQRFPQATGTELWANAETEPRGGAGLGLLSGSPGLPRCPFPDSEPRASICQPVHVHWTPQGWASGEGRLHQGPVKLLSQRASLLKVLSVTSPDQFKGGRESTPALRLDLSPVGGGGNRQKLLISFPDNRVMP